MKIGIILVLASAGIADPVSITGRASIVDGDTIEIQGRRVRLNGVDAPEIRQLCKDEKGKSYRCGKIAADALDGFLASSRPTTCRILGNDRYRRLVGSCYRADGAEVAAWMVRHGHALDWPQYSQGAYAAEEAAAKKNRAGVWRGTFAPPWQWRKASRR
ncbi:thermonuclease family protein [Sinorhizobium medicae]|uniref:thermonuclease family protein n=1 Tax=Sinorhizobium medicae TaxID=110321 RepID=UPI000C79E048|nr:thermonuclease family protein [Sinorhizobium medicae]MDX0977437.1 thermonuclease family protein [Sinorhizobium medicae]MQV84846.1 thermonuclease family protein [Sinorhizobium medicae]MQV95526.1 thermonuclease family protein [Sinorhizobium medicae]PLT86790.1 nuclease [Sinorhizobium medicae]